MGIHHKIVKNTFEKIFCNLVKEIIPDNANANRTTKSIIDEKVPGLSKEEAAELREKMFSRVIIGVEFKENAFTFYPYLDLKKVKEAVAVAGNEEETVILDKKMDLDDYTGSFDLMGGTTFITMALENYGKKYSEKYKCPVSDINALFQYNGKDNFPVCIIRVGSKIMGKVKIDENE